MNPRVWPLPPKFPKYFLPILILSCYLYYNYLCVINMHLSPLNKLLHSWYLHLLPGVMYIIMLPFIESLLCVTIGLITSHTSFHMILTKFHQVYIITVSQKTRLNDSGSQGWLGAELDMEPKLTLNHSLHGTTWNRLSFKSVLHSDFNILSETDHDTP